MAMLQLFVLTQNLKGKASKSFSRRKWSVLDAVHVYKPLCSGVEGKLAEIKETRSG
jgi:hypothetical protein